MPHDEPEIGPIETAYVARPTRRTPMTASEAAETRRVEYRAAFGRPLMQKPLEDMLRLGRLFERNDAVDHPQFNPMAAGANEGARRMCLSLIADTIGIDAAYRLIAEAITQSTANAPAPPDRGPRQAKTDAIQ